MLSNNFTFWFVQWSQAIKVKIDLHHDITLCYIVGFILDKTIEVLGRAFQVDEGALARTTECWI
jgi:hypothetical protein